MAREAAGRVGRDRDLYWDRDQDRTREGLVGMKIGTGRSIDGRSGLGIGLGREGTGIRREHTGGDKN